MVTAVVGHMIGMTLAMMSYYSCVVLVTILNPWLGLAAGVLVVPALLWAGWAMPRMRVRALVYREATSDVNLDHSGELLVDQAHQGVRHCAPRAAAGRRRLGGGLQRRLPGSRT